MSCRRSLTSWQAYDALARMSHFLVILNADLPARAIQDVSRALKKRYVHTPVNSDICRHAGRSIGDHDPRRNGESRLAFDCCSTIPDDVFVTHGRSTSHRRRCRTTSIRGWRVVSFSSAHY